MLFQENAENLQTIIQSNGNTFIFSDIWQLNNKSLLRRQGQNEIIIILIMVFILNKSIFYC